MNIYDVTGIAQAEAEEGKRKLAGLPYEKEPPRNDGGGGKGGGGGGGGGAGQKEPWYNRDVVAGIPGKGDINAMDYASKIATDPSKALTDKMTIADDLPTIDPNARGTVIDGSAAKYQMDTDRLAQTAAQATASTAAPATTVSGPARTDAQTYDAATAADKLAGNEMQAAQGQVDQRGLVDAAGLTIDEEATARGETGLGAALRESAQQNLDEVDARATVKGQMTKLQEDFTDPATGEPRIPPYAQAQAREVSKIAAFKGMTGSAATAALATALMEASLPIAQQDAKFYQDLTITNLNNKQQSIIQRAQVLANISLANMDARTTAAVTNAQTFMNMSLKNLDNEQQARAINTQARTQAILEDANQENVARRFGAESANEMEKFYTGLGAQIDMYNATEKNSLEKFNAELKTSTAVSNTAQVNAMRQFNADLENNREQYYKTQQFNIDMSNAEWRRAVTTQNAQMKFDAIAFDAKNLLGVQQEALNQLWDRSDALLDYAWKSSENDKDRKVQLLVQQLAIQAQKDAAKAADRTDTGRAVGSALMSFLNSDSGSNLISKLF